MYTRLDVKYPLFLSDFNENLNFLDGFSRRKKLEYQTTQKSVQWEPRCAMRKYRRTDSHDEANSIFFALLRSRLRMCATNVNRTRNAQPHASHNPFKHAEP